MFYCILIDVLLWPFQRIQIVPVASNMVLLTKFKIMDCQRRTCLRGIRSKRLRRDVRGYMIKDHKLLLEVFKCPFVT